MEQSVEISRQYNNSSLVTVSEEQLATGVSQLFILYSECGADVCLFLCYV